MSYANAHAVTTDILTDSRNRLIVPFLDIVQLLKPAFVLMENVCASLTREGGLYIRYSLGRLVGLRYQAQCCVQVGAAGSDETAL